MLPLVSDLAAILSRLGSSSRAERIFDEKDRQITQSLSCYSAHVALARGLSHSCTTWRSSPFRQMSQV